MARLKEATVDQMFSSYGEHIHWDLSLVRRPNDWEEESACNLLATLAAMEVKAQVNDELVWPLESKVIFSIKSFCKAVYDGPVRSSFPSAAIWRSKAPPQAFFFAWAAALEKVPTEDFFRRRNFHGPSRCVLCRGGGNSPSPSCALSLGFLAVTIGTLLDGRQLSTALEGTSCVSCLEKEDEEGSGFWCLEIDPFGNLVVGLERKEPKDF